LSATQQAPGKTEKPKRKINWFYSVLPFNIAAGPLGTFVQLVILATYGRSLGTVYAGLAITAFNAVTVPAAIIWGFATDRFHHRRPIIWISFLLVGFNLVAFLFTRSFIIISGLYGVFALLSSASSTPFNLLIMETEPKPKWASAFASFSLVSSVGVTLGLLLGIFWTAFLPVEYLVIPLAICSFASAIIAYLILPEPPFIFEREMIVRTKPSFFERLSSIPVIFLKIPRASDFRRVFQGLRFELTSATPILYLSIVFFYLSSGLFNTSLVPSLYANSLSESEVYLVLLVGIIVQILGFRYIGPYIEKRSLVLTAVASLALRSTCYAGIGVAALLLPGILYIGPTLILYPIAGGIAYAAYYTVSNTMVFNTLGPKSQGAWLGVYSALVGTATMAGSLASGFVSAYYGFDSTFVLAALCLAVGALLSQRLNRYKAFQAGATKA
jgi:MFS family permease